MPDEPVRLLDDAEVLELLRTSHRIAVVGASSNPARPSCGVFATLVARGYDCVPVNPNERAVHGVPAVATLAEAAAGGAIDIVDVFRRAEATEEIAREAVAVAWPWSWTAARPSRSVAWRASCARRPEHRPAAVSRPRTVQRRPKGRRCTSCLETCCFARSPGWRRRRPGPTAPVWTNRSCLDLTPQDQPGEAPLGQARKVRLP
jgi:predicted CoA-binding protein